MKEWISCSKKMPPNTDLVLVYLEGYGHDLEEQYGLAWWSKDRGWTFEAVAYYEGGRFDMQTAKLDKYVTAWCPLPEVADNRRRAVT